MNDLKNKLLSLKETKGLIRDAIVDREVAVPEGTPFRDYANRIRAIPLGGAAALNIAYGDTAPEDTSKLWVKGDAPKVVRIDAGAEVVSARSVANFGNTGEYTFDTAAAAVGNKIYLCCGGIDGYYTENYYDLLIFDTETGAAEYKYAFFKNSVGASYGHNVVAVGKYVYVIGGYEDGYYNNTVVELDTETMTTKTYSMAEYMQYMASVAVGKNIYIIGGSRKTSAYVGNSAISNKISVFNTENKTYQTLSYTLPVKIRSAMAAAVGNVIYIFGGYEDGAGGIKSIYAVDTSEADYSNAIRKLDAELPAVCYGWQAATIGKSIYVFYGSYVYKFDPETETVENMGKLLPSGNTGRCIAAIGDSVYLIGGDTGNGASAVYQRYSYAVDKFTPQAVLPEGEMVLEVDPTGQQVELVKMTNFNMQLGIRGVYRGNSEGIAEKAQAYLWGIRDILHGYEAAAQVSSGTELTAEVETKAGQLVIAAISVRDSFTLSDGWTLISESTVNSTDTTGQRLAFAYKYATADSESITVTQASAQRLYINLVALDGATGYTDNGYTYKDTETEATISAAKPAGLTLWACVAPLWSSVLPYPQWKADNDPYRIDLGDRVQSRLAIFLDQSEAETVTFTAGANSTAIVGCLTIEGMAELYEGDGSGWCEIK